MDRIDKKISKPVFGERLLKLRLYLKWTQKKLASESEISERTISRWVTKGVKPQPENIIKISEATRCNPRYLTGDEEIMFLARDLSASEAARFWNGLKEIIDELGWDRRQLSENTGISEEDIYGFENLKIRPTDEALTRIANVTGCRREWLLSWQGNKWDRYPRIRSQKPNVMHPKNDFGEHGGWTPQSNKDDWGFINKLANIINSKSKYTEALLLTIETYDKALREGETNRRKDERRKEDAGFDGDDRRRVERRQKTALGD